MTSFLQSQGWEAFQRSLGRKTERIQGILFIEHALPFGILYFYAPHPTIEQGAYQNLISELSRIAKRTGAVFSKIDVAHSPISFSKTIPTAVSHSIQPRESLILDISRSETELMTAMHPKTRYNIKRAEKHGVVATLFQGDERNARFAVFWDLLSATAKRDGFRIHAENYYRKLLALRAGDFQTFLAIAFLNEKPLAAIIIGLHGDRAIYLHGASSSDERNVMAPYLLHWAAIGEMKKRGVREYDWWGIDEKRWPGITRFKRGFGGRCVLHPPAVDIIHRRVLYTLYRGARALRRA